MSFRTRLLIASVVAVLVPLGALAYGVRREMERRLSAEYESRARALVSVMESGLKQESDGIESRLNAMARDLARDDRFRLAVIRNDPGTRPYLLDYAEGAMRLSNLSLLQVQDSSGRILSSGHFRNEFDRLQPELPRFLSEVKGMALVQTRTAEGPLLALARLDSFPVAGRRFTISGGVEPAGRLVNRLPQDGELSVVLDYPGKRDIPGSDVRILSAFALPYLDLLSGGRDTARFLVTQRSGGLESLRRSVDRWFLLATGVTVAAALLLAAWLSSRISQPLRELAHKTSAIDLDRLDQSFDSDRSDEIGALARLLGAMTERLRGSAMRLREAERRAAIGELAQQVNHDIKNGLTPIRNVLRHLGQLVADNPGQLGVVYQDRRSTLESSVDYLETLARNYARLAPGPTVEPCDANSIVTQVLRNSGRDGVELRARLGEQLPPVLSDALMLRRILENLIGNAMDSVAGPAGGVVTVTTEPVAPGDSSRILITVSDTGPGMTRAELDRIGQDFYTTKPGGTGLGLAIVRRLVLDLDGNLRIETEPGAGTRVSVDLPAHKGRASGPAS